MLYSVSEICAFLIQKYFTINRKLRNSHLSRLKSSRKLENPKLFYLGSTIQCIRIFDVTGKSISSCVFENLSFAERERMALFNNTCCGVVKCFETYDWKLLCKYWAYHNLCSFLILNFGVMCFAGFL